MNERASNRTTTRADAAPRSSARKTETGDAREARQGLSASPPEVCAEHPLELPDQYGTKSLNRAFQAHLARYTLGVTPFGLSSTFFTWWLHLLGSPGKQILLAEKAARKGARLATFMGTAATDEGGGACIEPLGHDHRFDDPAWRQWPFNLIYQSFLLTQQWWHNATNEIEGLSPEQERVVSFVTRQLLDTASPSNFVWSNPEVAQATLQQGGANLVHGFQHFLEDWQRAVAGEPPVGAEDYVPGRDVALTPGKVVYRNHLIELIQYSPRTAQVQAEPILIVPAWIMKYYILDLSPHNSLVGYLVDQGFTVFMISWRNPTAEDRDLGMADYLERGVGAALDAVTTIVPERKVHAVGYCIGGTLLATAAAAMARDGDTRLQSLTFFATQTDFSDAGELNLFITESEVSFLENMMWDQGYLDTKQMAGAFQLLRSKDLIWSRYVHEYLMGKRQEMFDLMAWNADATRMPYRMHAEYLRHFFLRNELAQGQYEVDGRPVALRDIAVPIFCVSTTSDHVAPWRSVYKLHVLADTDITFALGNGGHNAGIVSEPGHAGRHYRLRTSPEDEPFISPESWEQEADRWDGSWWPAWTDWLEARSSGLLEPPAPGGGLRAYRPRGDAPGTYVMQM